MTASVILFFIFLLQPVTPKLTAVAARVDFLIKSRRDDECFIVHLIDYFLNTFRTASKFATLLFPPARIFLPGRPDGTMATQRRLTVNYDAKILNKNVFLFTK